MHKGVTLIFYIIVLLIVVTHAPGFSADTTAIGGQARGLTTDLTGASTATSQG